MQTRTFEIPNSTVTGAIAIAKGRSRPTPLTLYLPNGLITSDLTFEISGDGGVSWHTAYDEDDAEYHIGGVQGNRAYPLPLRIFGGCTHIKLKFAVGQTGGPRTGYLTVGEVLAQSQ